MSKSRKIRVLLVDDHPVVLEGLKSYIATQSEINLVGEARSGSEAIDKIKKIKPDVAVVDVSLPDIKGYDIISKTREESPQTKFIVLSVYDHIEYIKQALKLGASGYVLKDSNIAELIQAIEAVYSGETYFCKKVEKIMANGYVRQSLGAFTEQQTLTPREVEILKLIAVGFSNKEIAVNLGISTRTVETHRERIMNKLDVHNSAGLIMYAIKNRIIEI
ncbi:MAG: response regulator [Verrucomicrobiia bacterium]